MTLKPFGVLADGTAIDEVVIGGGGLTVSVITWGAVVRDIRLDGVAHPLVLGFDDLDSYVRHSPYFGAVAGRYANRIAGGRLTIEWAGARGDLAAPVLMTGPATTVFEGEIDIPELT